MRIGLGKWTHDPALYVYNAIGAQAQPRPNEPALRRGFGTMHAWKTGKPLAWRQTSCNAWSHAHTNTHTQDWACVWVCMHAHSYVHAQCRHMFAYAQTSYSPGSHPPPDLPPTSFIKSDSSRKLASNHVYIWISPSGSFPRTCTQGQESRVVPKAGDRQVQCRGEQQPHTK